jgi:integrin alpha FG-GAP repeat containing protein 1
MYRHLLGRRKPLYGALIALLLLSDAAVAMWPFPPKRFSGNSLVDAGSMGINVQGRVIAFGDFNGDQLYEFTVYSDYDVSNPCSAWMH